MNKIWLILLISSIFALLFVSPEAVMTGMLGASNKALSLTFELCVIYAVWIGIFSILEQTGITKLLAKLLSPLVNWIFGKNNLSPESKKLVSMNISANLLGMNGAATPLGIKAIESMGKENTSATYPMIMLIIISCTSIQLLPTSIMGLMTNAGSTNASSIILPSIIGSICSTLIGILLVKLCNRIKTKIEARRNQTRQK
ncbi:MAG: hypothetical protein IJS68_02955 [Clostridia bacterium]|nr:hypothetical protein [Clostridia bacterium]